MNGARGGGEYKLGFASTAQWLSYSCGLAHRTAVEHVRIARSLRAWPQLADDERRPVVLFTGEGHQPGRDRLEASMATAALVEALVVAAQHGSASQLETLVRGLRTVHDDESAPLPRADRERVSQSWTSGSQWALSARLDPERGEIVRSALSAVAKAEDLSAAGALVRLAEIGLAALADGRARPLRGEEQAAIVVHVDATRVQTPEPSEEKSPARSGERSRFLPVGRIADGPGLPPRWWNVWPASTGRSSPSGPRQGALGRARSGPVPPASHAAAAPGAHDPRR